VWQLVIAQRAVRMGLHVVREADLRRARHAREPQLVPVALAARGRGDGEARFAGLDARERELER